MTNEQTSAQLPSTSLQSNIAANRIVKKYNQIRQKKIAVRPSQRCSPYNQVASCSNIVSTSCKRKADIQVIIIDEQDSESDSELPPPPSRPKRRRVEANDDLFIRPLTPCDELRFMARDLHFKWVSIDQAAKQMEEIFTQANTKLEFWRRRNIDCSHVALTQTVSQETVLQLVYSLMIEQENSQDSEDNGGEITDNNELNTARDDGEDNSREIADNYELNTARDNSEENDDNDREIAAIYELYTAQDDSEADHVVLNTARRSTKNKYVQVIVIDSDDE
jgi:hypothetical protein